MYMELILHDTPSDTVFPHDELIDGMVKGRTLNFIYGPPGCGKSTLAMTLAGVLASGKHSFFDHDLDRSKVLYVAGEDVPATYNRMVAVREAFDLADHDIIGLLDAQGAALHKVDPREFAELLDEKNLEAGRRAGRTRGARRRGLQACYNLRYVGLPCARRTGKHQH